MANTKKTPTNDETKARESFITLARGFDNAMLVTHTFGGALHARPMSIAEVQEDGHLLFITRLDTPKVEEIARDSRATVIMQGSNKYLRVAGRARVIKDTQKVKDLWSPAFKVWFEDANDPSIVIIAFESEDAEYWDVSGTEGLKFVLRAAKAALTGEKMPAQSDGENHGKVRLV